jgi:hypothetical protein
VAGLQQRHQAGVQVLGTPNFFFLFFSFFFFLFILVTSAYLPTQSTSTQFVYDDINLEEHVDHEVAPFVDLSCRPLMQTSHADLSCRPLMQTSRATSRAASPAATIPEKGRGRPKGNKNTPRKTKSGEQLLRTRRI